MPHSPERRAFRERRKASKDNQDSLKAFARTCVMLDNEKLKVALEESEKQLSNALDSMEALLSAFDINQNEKLLLPVNSARALVKRLRPVEAIEDLPVYCPQCNYPLMMTGLCPNIKCIPPERD